MHPLAIERPQLPYPEVSSPFPPPPPAPAFFNRQVETGFQLLPMPGPFFSSIFQPSSFGRLLFQPHGTARCFFSPSLGERRVASWPQPFASRSPNAIAMELSFRRHGLTDVDLLIAVEEISSAEG